MQTHKIHILVTSLQHYTARFPINKIFLYTLFVVQDVTKQMYILKAANFS